MKKYTYALGRSIFGGFSNSVGRLVVNSLPVYSFIFVRHLLIGITSLFFYGNRKKLTNEMKVIISNRDVLLKLLISCLLSGIGTVFFYHALKMLPVSVVSVFENGVYMIFVVILSLLFLKEKLPKHAFWYLGACIMGLFLIVSKGSLDFSGISILGITLLTINALLSSINSTISASVLKKISALTNTLAKSFSAALVGLLLMIVNGESILDFIQLLTFSLCFYLLYGVFSGFLIKYLTYRSIQELNSSKTAIFSLLTPVLSSFFAMFVFQEWFNFYQYLGMAFIIFSLYKLK